MGIQNAQKKVAKANEKLVLDHLQLAIFFVRRLDKGLKL